MLRLDACMIDATTTQITLVGRATQTSALAGLEGVLAQERRKSLAEIIEIAEQSNEW